MIDRKKMFRGAKVDDLRLKILDHLKDIKSTLESIEEMGGSHQLISFHTGREEALRMVLKELELNFMEYPVGEELDRQQALKGLPEKDRQHLK